MSNLSPTTIIGTPLHGINARLDRLPPTKSIWILVLLLSLGGLFEYYDLFLTAYIGPGLVKSGIFSTTTASLFGFTGLGAFIASMFAGFFISTFLFGGLADRFGRKPVFTFSLLLYAAATLIMAMQTTAYGMNLWRLISGIGLGVQMITIDSYISELIPKSHRGRLFAFSQVIEFSAVPLVALLSWWLVPHQFFHIDGWRLVVIIGALGSLIVLGIRHIIPESPRWLAGKGRFNEASQILHRLEQKVEKEYKAPLPIPTPTIEPSQTKASLGELWRPPYRSRTIMMILFNIFQALGFYGFAAWVPSLLIAKGLSITHSLLYAFIIALSNPLSPLIALWFADKIERKTIIIFASAGIVIFGLLFARETATILIMLLGILVVCCNSLMSFAYHLYQPELFPTRIRTRAVGLVYSFSRLSAMFSGFLIAFTLKEFRVIGVFTLISCAMLIVILVIGLLGPRSKGLNLDEISH